jgi:glutathione S-transferase
VDRVRELPGVKAWIDEALAEKDFWTLKSRTG